MCLCVCPPHRILDISVPFGYLGSVGTFWMKIEIAMEMEMEMGVEMKLDLLQCEIGFVPM